MNRADPSKHFCYRRMWYEPSVCSKELYLVYWGRLAHRGMLRTAAVSALVLLAYTTVTLALWWLMDIPVSK